MIIKGRKWLENQNQNKTKLKLPDISFLSSLDMERFGEKIFLSQTQ